MESKPTLAKLIASLDHKYVKEVAEYLVVLMVKDGREQTAILAKPFGEVIGNISEDYDANLRLNQDYTIRITKACYTTEKHLPDTLKKLLPRLQN